METMKAVVLETSADKKHNHPKLARVPSPRAGKGQVVVRVHAGALNHRDLWIMVGLYPGIAGGSVLGADGSGSVVEVGEGVDGAWLGKDVLVNPSVAFTSKHPHILGMAPAPGTFAERIAIGAGAVVPKPPHLTHLEGAAYCLTGLTAYRAVVTKGRVQAHHTVLVTGIGGGVALCALQFAVALGARVFVTSSSEDKIRRAVEMGAQGGLNYRSKDFRCQLQSVKGGIDVVIDGAGGHALNEYIRVMNFNGAIVMYGATAGKCENLNVTHMFLKQLELRGTTMGSDEEFAAMVAFVDAHKLRPVVDAVFSLDDVVAALDHLKSGSQFGKVVLRMDAHEARL